MSLKNKLASPLQVTDIRHEVTLKRRDISYTATAAGMPNQSQYQSPNQSPSKKRVLSPSDETDDNFADDTLLDFLASTDPQIISPPQKMSSTPQIISPPQAHMSSLFPIPAQSAQRQNMCGVGGIDGGTNKHDILKNKATENKEGSDKGVCDESDERGEEEEESEEEESEEEESEEIVQNAFQSVVVHFVGALSEKPGMLCGLVERNGGKGTMKLGNHVTHVVVGDIDEGSRSGKSAKKVVERAVCIPNVQLVTEKWFQAVVKAGCWKRVDVTKYRLFPSDANGCGEGKSNEDKCDEKTKSVLDDADSNGGCKESPDIDMSPEELNLPEAQSKQQKLDDIKVTDKPEGQKLQQDICTPSECHSRDAMENSVTSGDNQVCISNHFSKECNSNQFSKECNFNQFSKECNSNQFSKECNFNQFSKECNFNQFSKECNFNQFSKECNSNQFSKECNSNQFSKEVVSGNELLVNHSTVMPQGAVTDYLESIRKLLRGIQCEKWIPIFEEQQVDLEALLLLTNDDFASLGIPLGPRIKIQHALRQLLASTKTNELVSSQQNFVSVAESLEKPFSVGNSVDELENCNGRYRPLVVRRGGDQKNLVKANYTELESATWKETDKLMHSVDTASQNAGCKNIEAEDNLTVQLLDFGFDKDVEEIVSEGKHFENKLNVSRRVETSESNGSEENSDNAVVKCEATVSRCASPKRLSSPSGPIQGTKVEEEEEEVADGEEVMVKGSGSAVHRIKNLGGVYSCTCPAWRNQSKRIDVRTCKHIKNLRGAKKEEERIGGSGCLDIPVCRARRLPKSMRTGGSTVSSPTKGQSPPLLLAHPWNESNDYSKWLMSEKLDGVRALWDGKRFISRQGNEYLAPEWFVADLPKDMRLDGELWMGRGKFQQCVSVVRRQNADQEWKAIRYCIFDSPDIQQGFEKRIQKLETTIKRSPGTAHKDQSSHEADTLWGSPVGDPISSGIYSLVLPHKIVQKNDDIAEALKTVEGLGGEGMMLREPGSLYEAGRSNTLQKVKSFTDDEAVVIDIEEGKGRNSGRMGALVVVNRSKEKFNVGTGFCDAERVNPPPVGSVISYKYQELTQAKKPRFPVFLRMRPDIKAWKV